MEKFKLILTFKFNICRTSLSLSLPFRLECFLFTVRLLLWIFRILFCFRALKIRIIFIKLIDMRRLTSFISCKFLVTVRLLLIIILLFCLFRTLPNSILCLLLAIVLVWCTIVLLIFLFEIHHAMEASTIFDHKSTRH
jgi:hypothetical protein